MSILYRPDIDGLRAIAIILVLLYHFFPNVITGGYIGVDIFFVISGFLITKIITQELAVGNFSLSNFIFRRVRRLFPSLLLVLGVSLLLGYLFLLPDEYKKLALNAVGGLVFFANFTQYSEAGYFAVDPEKRPLAHLWSLSIEEQFYFIWPMILMAFWRKFPHQVRARKKIFLITLILAVISFLINIYWIRLKPDWVFYMPITRFWEICCGALLAFNVLPSPTKNAYKNALSGIGLAAIFFYVFILNQHSPFPGFNALAPVIGAILIIHYGASSRVNGILLSCRQLTWLGLISYPLFLWHWPLLAFTYAMNDVLPNFSTKIALIFATILVSCLTYYIVERPIRKSSNKLIIWALILFNGLLLICYLMVYQRNGFPSRLSSFVGGGLPSQLFEMGAADFSGQIDNQWRTRTCFLEKGQDSSDFSTVCKGDQKGNRIFLWGDSHAAAIYPGIVKFVEQNKIPWTISQFTASACPPLLDFNGAINSHCSEINQHNISLIKKLKPDLVILEAAWYWDEYNFVNLGKTLEELKSSGIKRIILMGPVPNWIEPVPKVIIKYYKKYKSIPDSPTDYMLDINRIVEVDLKIAEIAKKHDIKYISIYKNFCNELGCKLMTGKYTADIVSYDSGHLSPAAALFLIESNQKDIF